MCVSVSMDTGCNPVSETENTLKRVEIMFGQHLQCASAYFKRLWRITGWDLQSQTYTPQLPNYLPTLQIFYILACSVNGRTL